MGVGPVRRPPAAPEPGAGANGDRSRRRQRALIPDGHDGGAVAGRSGGAARHPDERAEQDESENDRAVGHKDPFWSRRAAPPTLVRSPRSRRSLMSFRIPRSSESARSAPSSTPRALTREALSE